MGILSRVLKRKKAVSSRSKGIKYTSGGKKKTIPREEVDKYKPKPQVVIIREKAKKPKAKKRRMSAVDRKIWNKII